jgi:hypothetical protein
MNRVNLDSAVAILNLFVFAFWLESEIPAIALGVTLFTLNIVDFCSFLVCF